MVDYNQFIVIFIFSSDGFDSYFIFKPCPLALSLSAPTAGTVDGIPWFLAAFFGGITPTL